MKVFISYSWDSENHKNKVKSFIKRLENDGILVIWDEKLQLGERITTFMEEGIKSCEYVLFICTPQYKEKSDGRKGGVGYECNIITGEIFNTLNELKFIPILFEGNWKISMPDWAKGKCGIDLCENNEVEYNKLINELRKSKVKSKNEDQLKNSKSTYLSSNAISDDSEPEDDNKNAFLFKIRLEIETLLRELCEKIGFHDRVSMITMLQLLNRAEVVNSITRDLIEQVIEIVNCGVHGEIVSTEYISFVKETYPEIVRQLKTAFSLLVYMICPRCKYSGYSKYENVCPQCGYIHDDY